MRKMKEDNPEFPETFRAGIKDSFTSCDDIIKRCANSPLETFKTLLTERNGSFKNAEAEFGLVLESGESDRFVDLFRLNF